jgi:hypothetical protein
MTTKPQSLRRPLRAARRVLTRALLVVPGIAGGLLLYFVCQGMFAGYPKYHTDVLSTIAMLLIAATGGAAWSIDQRRIDADD